MKNIVLIILVLLMVGSEARARMRKMKVCNWVKITTALRRVIKKHEKHVK